MQDKFRKTERKKFFWLILVFLTVAASILTVEGTTYLLYKSGRLHLSDKDRLIAIVKNTPNETVEDKPIYIPHPYFGYIYTPNNRFFQKTYMESNSEGFIDEEFPSERQDSLCVYGLLGGSAAMSWGVEKREERISYQLEALLNSYAKNSKCKGYRVLNMGVGSHIQYQATQIYLYYQDLLDGVIFYNGSNECSHASIFATSDPAQFPEINIYTMIQFDSPLKYKISLLRQELRNTAAFLLNKPYLFYSPTVRFLYTVYAGNKLKSIDELNSKISQESRSAGSILPSIKGKLQSPRLLFQKIKPAEFWYSDLPEFQEKLIRDVLPIVYTAPIINAYAVAKTRNTHFLSVVQPMSGAIKIRDGHAGHSSQFPVYQRVGNRILMEEAKKLEAYGIKTYNLNNIKLFNQSEHDIFIDDTHITAEGNKIAARYLFGLIQNKWHQHKNN